MSSLIISQAEVAFGGNLVLRGIDLEVPAGSCLVLLGPSGCGKTTLLNVISGSVRLKSGALVHGERALDDPAQQAFVPMGKRNFAMVFQDFSLWPHMTVGENVGFGLRVRGMSAGERRAGVESALQKVRMLDFIDRRPAELSGGQQQRVAIARALAVKPEVLLLDEPLSALDAKLREELKAELKLLLAETSQTAVYVTHDQSEAYALGHRVALMREGRIEQCAPPEEIYRSPRTHYVADFLGGANLMSFVQSGDTLRVDGLGVLPARSDFPERGWCFLRRESLRFEPLNGGHETGACVVSQFLGHRYLIEVKSKDGRILFGEGEKGISTGDPVTARFSPNHIGLIPGDAP